MVVGAVASEVTVGISQPRDLIGILGAFGVVHDIRHSKTQPIDVKPNPFIHIHEIKPEVAEATNFKGLIEKNPTDIEFLSRCSHGAPPKKQSME
jgi:hypothetical protein